MPDNLELNKLRGALDDAVTYPVLTKEVGGYARASRGGDQAAAYSGGALTRTAQGAIRDLIGWRYRADDPKGFLAALNKAVDLNYVEGHIESSWKSHPYMVQAELGEVTGAQASIYERARVAVEHALPILDMLQPLRPDADDQSTESIRVLVRSALTELLAELGNVGGPRIYRVNEYFTRLVAVTNFETSFFATAEFRILVGEPENVKGALGELATRFGFRRALVLTVDEEQTFTNFLIVVDYTTSLLQTWIAQKQFLERNDETNKFLGTQLVRLSQILCVIVESVHEAYDAMDSVFFGPEEREVLEIEFDGEPRITVAELLAWVEHFAGVEGPQLIEESGKDGVDAVRTTLERLLALVTRAVTQSENT